MHTTNLRKVGGSVMLAVPPALLDLLNMRVGSTVGVGVEGGKLIVEPHSRQTYRLEDLLAACDLSIEPSAEERGWVESGPIGDELF